MCRRHLALALSLWPFLGCGDADRGTHDAVDTTPGDTAEIADTAVDTTPQDVTPETQDVAPDTIADTIAGNFGPGPSRRPSPSSGASGQYSQSRR